MINTVYSVWIVLIRTMGYEWIPEHMYVVGQTYNGKSAHKAAKEKIEELYLYEDIVAPDDIKMKYCHLTIPMAKKAMKWTKSSTGHVGW